MPNSIISVSGGNWVVLDVAGKEFRTSRGSMQREPGSLLALMVDGTMDPDELCNESNGRIYNSDDGWSIDMDPRVFEALLKYLRTGKLVGRLPEGVTDEDLKSEAEFLRLPKLMELCDMSSSSPRDNSSISMMGSRYASTMSLYQHQHFPTINEPPPGIPTRPLHTPDIGHSVTATTAAAVGAHIAAPPGFRAPPGFDIGLSDSRTTNKFDNSSIKSADIFSSKIDNTGSLSNISSDLASNKFDIDGYKPDIISGKSESGSKFDISSNKFDISEALKEAFNSDPTDNSTATVVQQSLSALSPRSQNVQEAQNARFCKTGTELIGPQDLDMGWELSSAAFGLLSDGERVIFLKKKMENIEPLPSSTQQQTDVDTLGGRPLQPAMETADSSVGEQLKSIDEQKRIAQLEHEIFTVCKQLDEKSEKFKDVQDQNALLKDRLGTLEQEKLDAARFTESLVKSRDSLIQEKTDLQNDRLCLEKRKDELELQVSKLTNEKRRHLDDIYQLRNKCDQLFGEREQKINELRLQMLKEQSEMQRELSLFDERTTELTAKAEQLQENLLERDNEFPTINEPPPGIPIRPFCSPDIGYPVAAATVAQIAAPPGFRAPPGFDTTAYKSGSSTYKSNKFDISEALKEAFSTEGSDCTVPQPLSSLSPRSQNVQEAQNARLPMSSSFSSNENLHCIREPSPPPVAHTVSPAFLPLFAPAQNYQLVGAEVLDFQQVHQQMENRANEILTMVDGQSSPDRCLYHRFTNLGAVLHALQRLYRLHPDGFTVEQYVQFENRQKRGRPTQEGFFFNNIMPTVVSLLESDDDLLRVDRKNGTFHVSAEVAQTRLFCLGKNLCSNLFRLLRRYSDNAIRVQQLFDIAPKLVPKGAPAPDTNALLALCNCHPTIFKLCCSPQDNYRFDTAWIMLNDLLLSSENLTWRIVLDTDDF